MNVEMQEYQYALCANFTSCVCVLYKKLMKNLISAAPA